MRIPRFKRDANLEQRVENMRAMQDRYEGRAVPDRLEANRMRRAFNEEDREFIETSPFFFLSTASAESVDCSYKGGDPGFVRVVGDNQLAWPDFKIADDPRVTAVGQFLRKTSLDGCHSCSTS